MKQLTVAAIFISALFASAVRLKWALKPRHLTKRPWDQVRLEYEMSLESLG